MIALRQCSILVAVVALAGSASVWPQTRTEAPQPPSDVTQLIRDLGLIEGPTPVRDRKDWSPPRKVLVRVVTPELVAALKQVAPAVEIVPVRDASDAVAKAADADAVFGLCTPEILAAGPRIRWIQSYSAGVEKCVSLPAMQSRGVLLTNMQRVAGPVMAEHVIAMMLAFSRGLQFYIPEHTAARWTEELPAPGRLLTLQGKTVLVVGLGGIGTEVAKRAHALGMKVIATRASGHEGPDYVSYVGLPAELNRLAGEADFIVNTTPLTAATTGIFDAKFFAAARKGAYFFNVGRGRSVVQDDLVAALRSGQLGGAGLDVTDPEPLPPDHPLWKFSNVIITPHVSAESDEGLGTRVAIVQENLRRYVAGERMLSVVDLVKGY
jgi:phosphoglycerate dehydrogenase-like enzyme